MSSRASTRNLLLDHVGQLVQRHLPTQVAHFDRKRGRDAFLHDREHYSARHLWQRDGDVHFARRVQIVERGGGTKLFGECGSVYPQGAGGLDA